MKKEIGIWVVLCAIMIASVEISCSGTNNKVNENKNVTDSISIGEQIILYKMPYAYDHSIIYNRDDKKWHLYGIEAGNKTFIHLTADSLTQQGWEKHKPFSYKKEEIWAPHIIQHEGLYYMYFTNIGVPREIRLATSKDLFEWEHYSEEPLFAWSNEFTDNMKNKLCSQFQNVG